MLLGENGMPTLETSASANMDLFFKMGGSRKMSGDQLQNLFATAYQEYPALAVRNLFYNRDIRGGQGERRSFRIMLDALCQVAPDVVAMNLGLIPEYGRWDDLLYVTGPARRYALDVFSRAIQSGDMLACKWAPRENKKNGDFAKELIDDMGVTPRQYRKMIANPGVVENLMCANQWGEINYSHVPSIASKNYREAFKRHDIARYLRWQADLFDENSRAKVNAGAIFPHDICKAYQYGYGPFDPTLEAQWKALPDYTTGVDILPVCDVSGSMDGLPMHVSIALGVYLAEHNTGIFRNKLVTFSRRPTFVALEGNTLREKFKFVGEMDWGGSTNLRAVFALMLSAAKINHAKQSDLPGAILILSDMQFNECADDSAIQMIDREFREAGYERPAVYFWNLRTSVGVPVEYTQNGTALVSGFSPSILKNVLGGNINPLRVMLETLASERYAPIYPQL